MRVIIWAGYFLPHVGGYCHNIHELAKRLVAKGHEMTVVTCNTEKSLPEETMDGVRILRLPLLFHPGGTYPIPSRSKMLRNLMEEDHDVVVTQTRIFVTSLLGGTYAKGHKVPWVHVERGSCHTVLKSSLLTQLVKVYDHVVGGWIMSSADRDVGISRAACEFIRHLQRKRFPTLIYNGMNQTGTVVRNGHNDRVVFVGRLIYAKGVQDLISVFATVARDRETAHLVIVGDGRHRRDLEQQARELLKPSQVTFTGGVSQEEVIKILGKCDIFVNPSYSEGLPTTVMEAASLGMPIIATDVGGTKEIVHDGMSGILVKPYDTLGLGKNLEWMLSHRWEAERMGARAREIVGSFRWDSIAEQWDNMLKNLVKEKKAAR